VLKLIAKQFPVYATLCDNTATTLILSLVFLMSAYIFVKMVQGARAEVAAKKNNK
jgi:hypothetical protein